MVLTRMKCIQTGQVIPWAKSWAALREVIVNGLKLIIVVWNTHMLLALKQCSFQLIWIFHSLCHLRVCIKMHFSQAEHTFIVKHCPTSYFQLAYQTDFPDSPTYFNKSFLWHRMYKWEEVFQLIFSDESEEKIRESLLQSAQKSLRKFVQQSGLSCGSVHKASKICKFHPHCIQITAQTDGTDKGTCLQYYQWFWNLIQVSIAIYSKCGTNKGSVIGEAQ
jgi:hypothetical protein